MRRWLAAAAGIGVVAQELAARRYYARTPGPSRLEHEDEASAWTAAWHELWTPAEWLRLRASGVYRGRRVPRGDGASVVLVHGFLTRGLYLAPLRAWLERIGYRARVADIGWNVDCLDVLTERLREDIARSDAGHPVHLLGHSLGGLVARAAAVRSAGQVQSLTMLGTPFRGIRVHPLLRLASAPVRVAIHAARPEVPAACHTLACECPSVRALERAPSSQVPELAIVSRHDGLVDWRYCVGGATRVVAWASHVGTTVSPAAYQALAEHLAAAGRLTRSSARPA